MKQIKVLNLVLVLIIVLVLYLSNESGVCSSFTSKEHLDATCPANQYLSGYACAPCPAGSMSNEGATSIDQCVCMEPALLMDGVKQQCLPCPAGTYINPDGDKCIKCPLGTSSNEGSQSIRDCICPAGSELIGSTCQQCRKGYYKSTLGNNPCVQCPFNSYVNYEGAIESTECSCLARSYYDVNANKCLPCPKGTSSFDNWTSCKPCVNGKLNGQTCDCPAGKYLVSNYCVNCPANYYNTTPNTTQCSACPSGQGSETGSTTCVPCPAGSTSIMSNTPNGFVNSGCLCSPGMYMNNKQCARCPNGKTTSIAGAISINDCI